MQHVTTARLAGIVASGSLAMAAIVAPSAALATQPGSAAHKVTICHATNSDANPYVMETVDVASSGSLKGGHSDHTGPIWSEGLKADHIAWGDIIPAYTDNGVVFAGQNLADGGRELLDNECMFPALVVETTTETSTADQTTTADQTSSETTSAETTVAETTDATTSDTTETTSETTSDTTTQTTSDTIDTTDDGEVAVDDGFVTPDPSGTPVGEVRGVTGRPDMTPPPTDTIAAPAGIAANGGFQAILLVLAGLSTLVLVLGRVPAARRS